MKIIVLTCDGVYGKKPVYIDHRFKLYENNLYFVPNPNDLYAMDLAMKIKKEMDGVNITAISLGNARAANLVRNSMLIGADRGIWGDCGNVLLESSYNIGYILGKIIELYCRDFDLLLLGDSSQDYGSGLIGSILAYRFGLNIFDNVSLIESISTQSYDENRAITFYKKMEKGDRLICESKTPVIISVAGRGNGINGTCFRDIMNNSNKDFEVVKIEGLWNSNKDQRNVEATAVVFDGYHEPRPRPKKIYVPDSSLSAMDRLKNMTAGNMPKKATNMFEGETTSVAAEFLKYISKTSKSNHRT